MASTGNDQNTTETRLLDRAGVAREYGLNIRTLEGWALRGGGPPYVKLGRRCYYRREDLEAWFAANLRRHTSNGE